VPPHGRNHFGFYYIKQLVRPVKNPNSSPLNRLFCVPFSQAINENFYLLRNVSYNDTYIQ